MFAWLYANVSFTMFVLQWVTSSSGSLPFSVYIVLTLLSRQIKYDDSWVICPQHPKLKHTSTSTNLEGVKQAPQSEVATGCTAEIYCLLRVVIQGPGSLRDRSTFLYDVWLRSYGASNCPIFGFWPIFPIQNALKVPSGDQPIQPRGYIAEWLRFLPRDAMYKRGLCRHAVSVCLCVCHVRELRQNE